MKNLLSVILLFTLLPAPAIVQSKPRAQESAKAPDDLKAEADAAFLAAIEKNDTAAFNSLLETADVNASTKQGTTALMLAAFYKRPKFLVVLISRGADVNARTLLGNTALHIAVISSHVKMVKELLMGGADPNARSLDEMTALGIVLRSANPNTKSNRRIAELLRIHGGVE